ncbi:MULTISPECIES: hypothetical protein [unclassified Streptomyces]|uniref:hypothetical protein n=1 Tax=unclassified Streptomyces TaxID=2593676 RepID=UPI00036618A1|nr:MULTISPECIES: hypothetical protein [unclassified Streptomyces]MYX32764.1 hypothetical protein [Streptomyces sp. SID8377]
MSKIKKALRGLVAPLAAVGLVAGLSVAAAEPASASTIRDGWVQLCPWGNYKVHLEYAGEDNTFRQLGPVLNPGADCWWGPIPSGSKPGLIAVVGHYNTSSGTFNVIGPSREYLWFYNGKDGVGIAAEGTTANHGLSSYYYTY